MSTRTPRPHASSMRLLEAPFKESPKRRPPAPPLTAAAPSSLSSSRLPVWAARVVFLLGLLNIASAVVRRSPRLLDWSQDYLPPVEEPPKRRPRRARPLTVGFHVRSDRTVRIGNRAELRVKLRIRAILGMVPGSARTAARIAARALLRGQALSPRLGLSGVACLRLWKTCGKSAGKLCRPLPPL